MRGRLGEPGTSAALAEAFGALNEAAFRYGVLTTMAFRLYEPPLRELAPKHLRDYAEAAQAIIQLIPPAMAAAGRDRGLECQCICPMCSFGAFGPRGGLDARHINAALGARPPRRRRARRACSSSRRARTAISPGPVPAAASSCWRWTTG